MAISSKLSFGNASWATVCLATLFSVVLLAFAPGSEAATKKAQASATKKSVTVQKRQVVKTTVKRKSVVSAKRKAVVSSKRQAVVSAKRKAVVRAAVVPARLSFGQLAGLHGEQDDLNLRSSVALVMDQETSEILFSKNDKAVLPIASLTKLMTGLIITDANLPLNEMIAITQADVDTEKGSSSRLRVGSVLSRGELMHLSLMSSENRAAHALGRTFPGGLAVFTAQMNAKARALGMMDTRYVEPTGLSSSNQSSARDLAKLVNAAHSQPLLRELSTSPNFQVAVGNRTLQYNTTNRLVKSPSWDIGLQKTGYISEAGQCLVMQARVAGRKLIMVFLDSAGKLSRTADAERVRHWIEASSNGASAEVRGAELGG